MSKQKFIHTFFKPIFQVTKEAGLSEPAHTAVNSAIKSVNIASTNSGKKRRGSYNHYTEEFRYKVAKFAAENKDFNALRQFSKDTDLTLSESTIQTWRYAYLNKLKQGNSEHEKLEFENFGRPSRLNSDIEAKLMKSIVSLRKNEGVVNGRIIKAVATAIVTHEAPQILIANGGYLNITRRWSFEYATRMGFVARKGTRSTKADVINKDEISEQFRLSVKSVISDNNIPPSLVINFDETAVQLLPTASYTFEEEGTFN